MLNRDSALLSLHVLRLVRLWRAGWPRNSGMNVSSAAHFELSSTISRANLASSRLQRVQKSDDTSSMMAFTRIVAMSLLPKSSTEPPNLRYATERLREFATETEQDSGDAP